MADSSEVAFERSNLSEADLTAANLADAFLVEADLRGADVSWVKLHRTNLLGADLSYVKLHHAELSGQLYLLNTMFAASDLRLARC